MSLHSGSGLLERSVCFRDVRLGQVEDVLLAADGRRVLGFAVLCGDGTRRMLPLAVAELGNRRLQVASALILMEDGFYRKRCRTLTTLLGASVASERGGGLLDDVLFDDNGVVRRLAVAGPDGVNEIVFDDGVVMDGGAPTPAV